MAISTWHLCYEHGFSTRVIPQGLKVRRSFLLLAGREGLDPAVLSRFSRPLGVQTLLLVPISFSRIGQCLRHERLPRVAELASKANVELMTHPIASEEYRCLMSEMFQDFLHGQRTGSYSTL